MNTRLSTVIFAAALAAWPCAASVGAQTEAAPPSPSPSPTTRQQATATSVADADVAITARVNAREVRFEKVPNPKVEFPGRPRRETVWQTERENLPDEVRPGVTYRDVGIRLRITSVFADIDRIVAEALGERPVTDDQPPAPRPQPQNESPPATRPPAAPDAPAAPRASNASPATTPATNNATTRQRRGTTRGGRP